MKMAKQSYILLQEKCFYFNFINTSHLTNVVLFGKTLAATKRDKSEAVWLFICLILYKEKH